jgi:hypothetical protein
MTLQHIVGVSFSMMLTSTAAMGQHQPSGPVRPAPSPNVICDELGECLPAQPQFRKRSFTPSVSRHEYTEWYRDINGRRLPAEQRTIEIREIGPSENLVDETVRRTDINGNWSVTERTLTRRSEANGRELVEIERYSIDYPDVYVRGDQQLALSQRIHISTTPTAEGGSETVTDLEARNPVAVNEPLHVSQRTITTVRRVGPDRWLSESHSFERDVNGQLVPISSDAYEHGDR